jgi:TPP-dependent pyruvate/acetoin dehydrogenase alpha subunit
MSVRVEEVDPGLARDLFYKLLLVRRFEEKILEMFAYGKLAGTMFHVCIGQEAVAVGACSALDERDYLVSTHRGHGHFIMRGGNLNRMMAELYGKATGYCKGKGGSMHIADINLGHLGANGIVGGGLPLAVGAGLAAKIRGTRQVVMCSFGDGAAAEGTFHESLNFASVMKLPVIYVCENNLYAMSTAFKRGSASQTIAERASAYAMPGKLVDGMDVLAVRKAMLEAVERARAGIGPTLIEAATYRFFGHSRGDPSVYRTREEEAQWKKRCPVATMRQRLLDAAIITEADIVRMEEEIASRLALACEFADKSPYPEISALTEDVYA